MDKIIEKTAAEIAGKCRPEKIYLISMKTDTSGELISFKLGVILGAEMKHADLEEELYTSIDCDVPFDLVLYTSEDWDELSAEPGTFAWKILNSGTLLYG